MSLLDAALNLLFPPKCPFCRRVGEEAEICPACRAVLPWTEGDAVCAEIPGGVCAAPLFYEDAVRQALLCLKFREGRYLAAPLGRLLAQCAAEEFSGMFDVVTWVPVGPKRLRQRGYDQAQLLAECACRQWETVPERLLEKPMDNPAQSTLSDAAQRRANVLGAYSLAAGANAAGRRVLVIDDICTTGATLGECVRVLRDGGAAEVVCAVVARTRERSQDGRQGPGRAKR